MICPKCKKELPSGSVVCGFCGNKISASTKSEKTSFGDSTTKKQSDKTEAKANKTNISENAKLVQASEIFHENEKRKLNITAEEILKRYKPLSTFDFFVTEFLLLIPILNIILLFVWSFSKNSNVNRKSFSRSLLIWAIVELVVFLVLIFFSSYYISYFLSSGGSLSDYLNSCLQSV